MERERERERERRREREREREGVDLNTLCTSNNNLVSCYTPCFLLRFCINL